MSEEKREKITKEYLKKGPLPKVDFITFVMSLSSSALVHLGEVSDPVTGKTDVNLELARHTIDVLSMLEEKTRGNLSREEEEFFKNILFELKMKYVQRT
ncbi:DUF1844 domain-containing protein [Desulfothermus okinawensis JCM 13304]